MFIFYANFGCDCNKGNKGMPPPPPNTPAPKAASDGGGVAAAAAPMPTELTKLAKPDTGGVNAAKTPTSSSSSSEGKLAATAANKSPSSDQPKGLGLPPRGHDGANNVPLAKFPDGTVAKTTSDGKSDGFGSAPKALETPTDSTLGIPGDGANSAAGLAANAGGGFESTGKPQGTQTPAPGTGAGGLAGLLGGEAGSAGGLGESGGGEKVNFGQKPEGPTVEGPGGAEINGPQAGSEIGAGSDEEFEAYLTRNGNTALFEIVRKRYDRFSADVAFEENKGKK